jgi:hypothetical protein
MSNSVETSALDIKDPEEHEYPDAALRNRSGDAADISGDKKTKVNETAVETPFTSNNEADSEGSVEYVKGHPVIKNGTRNHQMWKLLTSQS